LTRAPAREIAPASVPVGPELQLERHTIPRLPS
jgi:hypothetical protein